MFGRLHDRRRGGAARHVLRIERVAIMDDAGKVWAVERPGRHHDVIKFMRGAGYLGSVHRQGFVHSNGKFVERKRALSIATRAGQLLGEPSAPAHGLFSEDVW
jgi:hypothetical protein